MPIHSSLMLLLAGVTFLMFGMTLAADYLQRMMSNRVRELMQRLSSRPAIAIIVGVLLTIFLQSSGAVTSMLVGLGSAGVITLTQVMGVIIGSALGSTLTVQLISFNLAQYGLPIFVIGFAFYFSAKRRVLKYLSGVLVGFGLVFYGLELMSVATTAFKSYGPLIQVFEYLRREPLVALIFSALFTGFVHSSAVTIGLAMSLASSGLLTLEDSMWWIYGANIGTTSTALMASIGGNYVGRQVAWSHFFYKFGSFLIFLPVTAVFAEWVSHFEVDIARDVANAHTLFNFLSALVFYPFIGLGAIWMEKLFQPSAREREFTTKFINAANFDSPNLAYAQAMRESLRMADIVTGMVRDSIRLFESDNPDLVDDIRARDNKVDLLFREIKSFMVRFTDKAGSMGQNIFELISLATDLESAADIIEKQVVELAEKKNQLKLEFSAQGWSEIKQLHGMVIDILELATSCFQLQDPKTATELIDRKRRLKEFERQLRESHLDRLNQGLKESLNTSSIHLELLGDYRRVAGLFSNYAYYICRTHEAKQDSTHQAKVVRKKSED